MNLHLRASTPAASTAHAPGTAAHPHAALDSAAAEAHAPLPQGLQRQLHTQLGHDFGHVRVHGGPRSAAAADQLGARAYTLGRDVHLGSAAHQLGTAEQQRLLAHEAVHTVQQGGASARPHAGLAVSRPGDAAEREAQSLADGLARPPSASLALRDRLFGHAPTGVQQAVAPQVQRDLIKQHPVHDGEFDVNLKTESHAGATSGMSGSIDFTPGAGSPDSKNIRMLQVVRLEDLGTGKDYVWTGAEADRNKAMTTQSKSGDVTGGFFVDHSAAAATPRTAKADAAVSPYYRDYWPNTAESQDGSKQGKTVQEASLWDYPGWTQKCRFTFETAAKAVDTGYVYATLRWGFTISDPAKGTVGSEHAKAYRGPSATFGAAVQAFNDVYKNPGSSGAPTK